MRITLLASLIVVGSGCATLEEAGSPGGSETGGSTMGSTGQPPVDTKPWDVETETNPPSMSTGGEGGGDVSTAAADAEAGSDAAADSEEDAGDEEGVEEDFVGIFGFGDAVPGESYSPQGEAVAFFDGVDECIVHFTATAVVDDTCAACDFAFRLTVSETTVEEDLDCASYGFDPPTLEGSELAVGLGPGRALYVDEGEGWQVVDEGFAEYIDRRGVFEWELAIEP